MTILSREEIAHIAKARTWLEECDTVPEENHSNFFSVVGEKFEELIATANAYHDLLEKLPAWLR